MKDSIECPNCSTVIEPPVSMAEMRTKILSKLGFRYRDPLAGVFTHKELTAVYKFIMKEPEKSEAVDTLFDAIKHGDQDHQDWLKEAIECHFSGRPIPPPRG